MKQKNLIIAIIVTLVCILGVTAVLFMYPYSPTNPPAANDTGSTPSGINEVVDSNNKFALDLYNELKSEEGNIFYSSYSIYSALGMTYEGAKGETANEMEDVFGYPDNLKPNFAAVYNSINNREGYELRTGNALWVQEDYKLLDNYVYNVEKYYGGKASNLNFKSETEKSRETINNFIEEQTNNKIKDLIPEGALNPMTRLVLTNAVYFKGDWKWEFDKSKTMEMDFRLEDGSFVEVPMMHMEPDEAEFNYADLGNLQVLELPYKSDEVSMLVLLPNRSVDDLNLTLENINKWKNQMEKESLDDIYLPKFEFDSKYMMKDTLSKMGMPTAFEPNNADFSGMSGQKDLFISSVIHQSYVKVDEKGTEAAAATGVVMETTSFQPGKVFRADHPFVFMIQDKETGSILFMGRVSNPNV